MFQLKEGFVVGEQPSADSRPDDKRPVVYIEIERQLMNLISQENQETAKNILNDLIRFGRDGYQFAVDLISELATELTGVKSLKIIPRGQLELDVEIKRKKDLVLKLRHHVAPLVELNAITFGEELSFGALLDKEQKGLRMAIRKGLSMTFNLGPIEKQVDFEGTGILTRNQKKQLVLSISTVMPGTESPVTISIPLTQLFAQKTSIL